MRKYTKKELKEIFSEIVKYVLAQFVLKKFANLNDFQIQILKNAKKLEDLDKILSILSELEKNLLKANISAKSQKFLKYYERLWIYEKQKFLSENWGKLLLSLWENIQKNLV